MPAFTRTNIAICLGLAAVTFALYSQTAWFDFVNYDDELYVTQNSYVRAGLTLRSVKWAFASTFGFYHPLTWLSLMLDVQLFGLHPAAFHLENVCFHAANGVLVFLILARMTRQTWPSALVAALFAWHPLSVESVAWVSERKGLLSGLFFFLSIWNYLGYAERRSPSRYSASLGLFAASLLAKPASLPLPALLLLLDFWPLRRLRMGGDPAPAQTGETEDRRGNLLPIILEKLPFVVLSVIMAGITLKAEEQAGALDVVAGLSASDRFAQIVLRYLYYLGQAVWPANLAAAYPFPNTYPVQDMVLALGLLVALFLAVWRWRLSSVAVGLLWYYLLLLPVIGVRQIGTHYMADRYMYIPQIGVFVALVWPIAKRLSQKAFAARVTVAGAVLGACLACSAVQIRYWRDSVSLFKHAVAATENNYVALNNLAWALATDRHRSYEDKLGAVAYAKDACALTGYATVPELHTLATAQFAVGEYRTALATLDAALRVAIAQKEEPVIQRLRRDREHFLRHQTNSFR